MTNARAGLVLACALLAFFSPVLLGGKLLAPAGDALSYYYPVRVHAAALAREGTVPLWSPALFGGFPLLADVEVGVLYPPNLLFLALPPVLAMNLIVVFTYWLAGVATFLYCRGIGASTVGALTAAFSYMLSGSLVAHLGHVTIIGAAAWLPLLLHLLERLRAAPSWRRVAGLSLALALQALGGHPQLVLGSWLLCALYAAASSSREAPRERRRFLARSAAGAALAVLAAAAQWLPTLELQGRSVRSALSFEGFIEYSLHPAHLLGFFFPFLFGTPTAGVIAPAWWGHWTETEMSGYVGLTPWLLAALALARPRGRLWLALGATFLLLALSGYTPLAGLLHWLPVYGLFRAPARNLLFVDLALSVLAGLGATRLIAESRAWDLRRAGAVLLGGLAAAYLLLANAGPYALRVFGVAPPRGASVLAPASPALLLPLMTAALVWAAWRLTARRPRSAPLALAAVLLDLGLVGEQGFWRVAAPAVGAATDRLPALRALARVDPDVRAYRVLSLLGEQNASLPHGLRDAAGSSSLAPARTVALLGGMDSAAHPFDSQALFEGHALDVLGVRYVVAPVEFASPRATRTQDGRADTPERFELRLSAEPLDEVELELPVVRSSRLSVVAAGGAAGPRPGQPFLRARVVDAEGRIVERTLLAREVAGVSDQPAIQGSLELGGPFDLQRVRLTSLWDGPLQLLSVSAHDAAGRTLLLSSRPSLVDPRLTLSRRHAEARADGAGATALSLQSALLRAASVAQGQAVARVTVSGAEGPALEHVLRAGVDTAEWAWDRPDVRFRVKHARAPLATSTRAGWFYDAHRYRTRVELGRRMAVETVALEYLAPSAGLDVFELRLEDATTGRSLPLELDRRRLEPDAPGWAEHGVLELTTAPVRATRLELSTALEDSALLQDGAPVARVVVETEAGTQTHALRAGTETSEWAWERPDVRSRVRHARAPGFTAFPADSGTFQGHWYAARFDLGGEPFVQRVRIERLSPRAGLVVAAVTLRDAAGRALALYQREAPVRFDGKAFPLTLLPGASQRAVELPLPATRASSVSVVSALRHSVELPQAQAVARLDVRCEDAAAQRLWLRAGVETSESGWAHPDVRARVRHGLAPIATSAGPPADWRRDYLARLELPIPCRVNRLGISYVAPEAMLSVTGLSLFDAGSRLATPVSAAGARLAESGRWRRRLDDGGRVVFENLTALPRAWLVPRALSLPAAEVLRTIRSGFLPDGSPFEPRAAALVEQGGDQDYGPLDPNASVAVAEPSSGSLRLTVRSGTPAFLVVSDRFDPGWRARLDGEPVRLLATNFVQRGVPIPAGQHELVLTYDPWTFGVGAWLSGLALALLLGLCVARGARGARSLTPPAVGA
jgi:hypothetical protein